MSQITNETESTTYQAAYFKAIDQLRDTQVYNESQDKIYQLSTQLSDKLPEEDKALVNTLMDAVMEQVASEYDYANFCFGLTSADYAFQDILKEVNG